MAKIKSIELAINAGCADYLAKAKTLHLEPPFAAHVIAVVNARDILRQKLEGIAEKYQQELDALTRDALELLRKNIEGNPMDYGVVKALSVSLEAFNQRYDLNRVRQAAFGVLSYPLPAAA